MSDKCDENSSNTQTTSDDTVPTLEVHSANSWETADLGDDNRKNKFLRLMGAGKKEHKGKIVIGNHDPVHGRDKSEVSKMSNELEAQYEQSMEHRRLGGRRGHIGLGFNQDEEDKKHHEGEKAEESKTAEQEKEKPDDGEEKDAETGEKEERCEDASDKRKHSDDSEQHADDAEHSEASSAKKMKMNFVKSSS